MDGHQTKWIDKVRSVHTSFSFTNIWDKEGARQSTTFISRLAPNLTAILYKYYHSYYNINFSYQCFLPAASWYTSCIRSTKLTKIFTNKLLAPPTCYNVLSSIVNFSSFLRISSCKRYNLPTKLSSDYNNEVYYHIRYLK